MDKSLSSLDRVGPGYLETMGQTIVRSRSITEQDTGTSRNVAVVSEAFAKQFFPTRTPLENTSYKDVPQYNKSFEIVGVVRDAKYNNPGEPPKPMFYAPLAQHVTYDAPIPPALFEHHSHYISGAVPRVAWEAHWESEPLIRKTFSEVDPNLTIINVQSRPATTG